jgi:hypothetical protein
MYMLGWGGGMELVPEDGQDSRLKRIGAETTNINIVQISWY